MKIAIIASGFLPVIDGVTVSGFYRLKKLSQWGHQVLLFCPDYRSLAHIYANWQEYTGEILPGVKVINLASTPFFVEFETNVAFYAYNKLIRELEQFQPDIIHVDEPERVYLGFWQLPAVKFAKKHNIPCVGFFRTNFLEYLEDFFPLPAPLFAVLYWFIKKLILRVYNSYDVTLVSSTVTQEKIIQLGIKNTLYRNLLGFEQNKFTPSLKQEKFFTNKYQLPNLENKVKLVFLGRLTPDKGWDFTLNNLEKIFQAINVEKIAFLIVGDGESRNKIATTLSKFTPHFHLFGRIDPADIPAILANSDIHVTTSEKETRGLTILEALASGIPVLAPNAGGVVENIQDGVNGFLYHPRNSEDFVNKLKLLVEDSTLRYQMGTQGRLSIRDKYSWTKTVQNLLDTWQEQIDNKHNK
ncbi:MAG: glycosyltransferase [Xenococcaceae cyanobacterium MO_207.B15]|nr:glycosyltransferase [Xenococcaceae cyanobacterium MO_207.B15]MDJ0744170.1 glycosyltransferase [Xenococcaceae cyanobacterium MO_167.B27]